MDDAKFDRLATALSTILTRRGALAIFGAFAGMIGQRVARASQPVPATCGEEGAVCTLVVGCCDGLTCVTSAINTGYGICVPGEGGMVSTGTTLISPFSEFAVDEATALLQDASNGSSTDPLANRKARIADARARRDANEAARRARLDARRSAKHTPSLKTRLRPHLKLELLFDEADGDSETPGDQLVPIEIVRATNRDDFDVVLTRIETIQGSTDGVDLPESEFTLKPGESYSFVSGLQPQDVADVTNHQYRWLSKVICDESVTEQGYRLTAAFSPDAKNYAFTRNCDKARGTGAVETASESPRRKRKRNDQQQKKKR